MWNWKTTNLESQLHPRVQWVNPPLFSCGFTITGTIHNYVSTGAHFQHYCPFVKGIHWSYVGCLPWLLRKLTVLYTVIFMISYYCIFRSGQWLISRNQLSIKPLTNWSLATPHSSPMSECWHRWVTYYCDVMIWKHFPHYWPFVRRIHRSPANQTGPVMRRFGFHFVLRWTRFWTSNAMTGDLRRLGAHVMWHHCNAKWCFQCRFYVILYRIIMQGPFWVWAKPMRDDVTM